MATDTEHLQDRRWLDDPLNVRRVARGLYILCAVLAVVDVFVPKHGVFAIEHLPAFYAVFGFTSSIFLVLTAKQLRRVLKRPEDYYDR